MADLWVVDPVKKFQVNGDVCQLFTAAAGIGVGNNAAVVSAVTGKRIRVMGWRIQSQTSAQATYAFKSASGGTFLTPTRYTPIWGTLIDDILDVIDSGYFETNTGEGLYVDVTIEAIAVMVFYITYKPL